ncbi:MAG TPA: alpha/beta hydrolase, partial [Dehalococcoidia bacterium]|nr:alpha/beta hydrolase [Dehalococcoidia bacterium]
NDTGGAIAQIFAARNPQRLASLVLTNCETHDNVPPPALKASVRLARIGLLTPLARLAARFPRLGRRAVFASGYEHPERLSDELVRAYLQPTAGTPLAAKQFTRWVASANPHDLLAAEPQLRQLRVPTLVVWGTGDVFFDLRWAYWLRETIPGVTEVVEFEGARLFFPDERADDLVVQLRRHWAYPAARAAGSVARSSAATVSA